MMKKYQTLIIVSIIALAASAGISIRSFIQKRNFDSMVTAALETSEGYDQKFIDMVNRLEDELALRASFGYNGQKDPMTGKERIVVRSQATLPKNSTSESMSTMPEIDAVKLTAIIYDDEKELHTAIIMDGERSYAIEINDQIIGRRVNSIDKQRVVMEDMKKIYWYDITGEKGVSEK